MFWILLIITCWYIHLLHCSLLSYKLFSLWFSQICLTYSCWAHKPQFNTTIKVFYYMQITNEIHFRFVQLLKNSPWSWPGATELNHSSFVTETNIETFFIHFLFFITVWLFWETFALTVHLNTDGRSILIGVAASPSKYIRLSGEVLYVSSLLFYLTKTYANKFS